MHIKLNEMQDTKLALDLYALHEIEDAQVRSRLKCIDEGERNTKYFLGLEKSNFNKKNVWDRWKKRMERYVRLKMISFKYRLTFIVNFTRRK